MGLCPARVVCRYLSPTCIGSLAQPPADWGKWTGSHAEPVLRGAHGPAAKRMEAVFREMTVEEVREAAEIRMAVPDTTTSKMGILRYSLRKRFRLTEPSAFVLQLELRTLAHRFLLRHSERLSDPDEAHAVITAPGHRDRADHWVECELVARGMEPTVANRLMLRQLWRELDEATRARHTEAFEQEAAAHRQRLLAILERIRDASEEGSEHEYDEEGRRYVEV